VDRLVDAGLVERRTTPGDRRSNALFLTELGSTAAEEGIRLQKAFVAETLGSLLEADIKHLDGIISAWREAVRNRVNKV
jgi:MarR family transcriptional regulator, organic hydroperoxide resistance regulator